MILKNSQHQDLNGLDVVVGVENIAVTFQNMESYGLPDHMIPKTQKNSILLSFNVLKCDGWIYSVFDN